MPLCTRATNSIVRGKYLQQTIFKRHVSRKLPHITQINWRPSLVFSIIGSTAVATYFFWPDSSRSAPTYSNALLSPSHFTPVVITSSEPCNNPDTRLITLTVPPQSLPPNTESTFSPIWSVYVKDDDIQVERPYTPLTGIDKEGRMRFWIKKYPKGEVGRWLHSRQVGDYIEVRGPLKTMPWEDRHWDEVVMISGGTGITPFFQLLHSTILSRSAEENSTRFTLLHCCRTPAELPPPEILDTLQSCAKSMPERFKMFLHVDSAGDSKNTEASLYDVNTGRIGKIAIQQALGQDASSSWLRSLLRTGGKQVVKRENILFLVCGPDPMIASIAGPWGRNFSQGRIAGVLGELGYGSEQVRKL